MVEWTAHPTSTSDPSRTAIAPESAAIVLDGDITGDFMRSVVQLSTYSKQSFKTQHRYAGSVNARGKVGARLPLKRGSSRNRCRMSDRKPGRKLYCNPGRSAILAHN
jgi:hypothetical protein